MNKWILAPLLFVVLAGCQSGTPTASATPEQVSGNDINAYIQRTGGDMDLLTAQERDELLQQHNGSEAELKAAWDAAFQRR